LQRNAVAHQHVRYQNKLEKIVPDFGTTLADLKDPSKLDFTNFELSAETAVVLWHLNRGLLHFSLEDIDSKENNLSKLFSEIEAKIPKRRQGRGLSGKLHSVSHITPSNMVQGMILLPQLTATRGIWPSHPP
jgi:hypothetical protein